MASRMLFGVGTQEEPARLDAIYEVHYMLFETKKLLMVSRDSMWLERAWLSVLVRHGVHVSVVVDLTSLEHIASRYGIRDVRWNKAVPVTLSFQERSALQLDIPYMLSKVPKH